jgi:hypothetical protein
VAAVRLLPTPVCSAVDSTDSTAACSGVTCVTLPTATWQLQGATRVGVTRHGRLSCHGWRACHQQPLLGMYFTGWRPESDEGSRGEDRARGARWAAAGPAGKGVLLSQPGHQGMQWTTEWLCHQPLQQVDAYTRRLVVLLPQQLFIVHSVVHMLDATACVETHHTAAMCYGSPGERTLAHFLVSA